MPLSNVSRWLTLDSELFGAILLCTALIALGIFVLGNNPSVPVNRRFGLMALTTAGWILTISLALAAKEPRCTVILGRVGFAFASGIPYSLVWMVDSVSDPKRPRRLLQLLILGLLSLVFVFASFSPFLLAGARPNLPRAQFIHGPLHRLFGLYFLACFASGIHTLWITIRSSSGIHRLHLRYLLLGISLTGAGAITTNLLIPLIWHTSTYSSFGPYFSLFFFSFSAHAIIRHRLMDIRVVVRQGIVYFSAIVVSLTLFLFAAELLRQLAHYDKAHVPLFDAAVVATALAIFFQPLKGWLNRYLYRETYDYHRTIRAASRQLSTMLNLQPLLHYLTGVIETTFKVEAVFTYLRDDLRKVLVSRSPHRPWHHLSPPLDLPYSSPLVDFLQNNRTPLVREETARHASDPKRLAAAEALKHLGGDIAFPLSEDRNLLGIIIVGAKRSGDPYFAEDLELLETLVGQAAGAMQNAQLYQQVVLVNEYLDNILSTMDSGVIAITADGVVSLFNRAAQRLTGISALAVKNAPYYTLPTALALPLRDTLRDHQSRSQFEVLLQSSEGATVPVICSTAILKQAAGDPHGALVVFSDLTRVKHLEFEKRRAERLAAFGALASGVAHEIKNPLVAIRTFAELLPERFSDTDFREDFARVVVREIDRIDDLVGRLRGIAGTAPQQVANVDMRAPITDTLRLLRAQLDQTKIVASCDFTDSEPFVAVDESQLKQLFLNLFLNAIEAMGPGGQLTVHLYRRLLPDAHWIVVSVSDTGPGMPDEIRANVFDPFFTTKPRGSGLGLAVCRAIADANHGTIRAENRPDRRGATIIVEFPATSVPVAYSVAASQT